MKKGAGLDSLQERRPLSTSETSMVANSLSQLWRLLEAALDCKPSSVSFSCTPKLPH